MLQLNQCLQSSQVLHTEKIGLHKIASGLIAKGKVNRELGEFFRVIGKEVIKDKNENTHVENNQLNFPSICKHTTSFLGCTLYLTEKQPAARRNIRNILTEMIFNTLPQ